MEISQLFLRFCGKICNTFQKFWKLNYYIKMYFFHNASEAKKKKGLIKKINSRKQ